ncbi:TPA: hypothetical protein R0445_004400 [Salmonella enterica subsp. enterica serovar Hvittingfoss]|nr:hypothetical protein [Salmonella enterica subsp. enterica serovar Hvittingfoss]
MKVITIILITLLTPQICSGKNFSPEFVKHVFLNLDITSFPSSMGPKNFPEGTTMKETFKYFSTFSKLEINSKQNAIEIYFNDSPKDPDLSKPGWEYDLKILYIDENKKITACYTDMCHGLCTYAVIQPLTIEEKKGKYVVTHAYDKSINGCEYYIDSNG